MTALEALNYELNKIDDAIDNCISKDGCIKISMRYRAQILFRQKEELTGSIEWLTKLYEE